MALTLRAPVTVLHAFDAGCPAADLSPVANAVATIREHLRRRLAGYPGVPTGTIDIRREVVAGHAVESILHCAAQMEEPLIMLATRGQSHFRTLLLGSVTAGVLHDSPWPVWTDAHREVHAPHTGQYRTIVCATDMGQKTQDLLRAAKEFSVLFGAELHIVHSVPGVDPRFSSALARRAHAFLVQEAREQFPAHCQAAGFDAHLEIVEDTGLAEGIAGAVSRHGGDLLIIGRGAIQGLLGRLRSNAHALIRSSPCPVLSL